MADVREHNAVFKGRSGLLEDISNDSSVDGSDDIPSFVAVVSRKRGPNKKKASSIHSDTDSDASEVSSGETVETVPADVPQDAPPSPMFRRR